MSPADSRMLNRNSNAAGQRSIAIGERVAFEEQVVNGRYRLSARVGRGAMSVVWQAKDERLDKVVAVKQLRQDPAAAFTFDTCERAIREARLASRLDHPHAIAVYDVLEDSGSMYLVMEYLPSRPLTDLLIERGPMPPDDVVRLGRQIASALAAAHAKDIVHHDVSPNNVLVTDDGTAKITDFGVSRALGENRAGEDGVIVGTPAYLAPEIAAGTAGGLPSDVYSLGATLYTALEGAPPFGTSESTLTLFERIVEDDPTPPAHAGPLADVLMRLLERDPAARPTMPEVVDLLASVAEPGVTTASADSARSQRRLRRAVFGVTACLISAGVAAGLALAGHPGPVTAAAVELPGPTVTTDHTVGVTTTAAADPVLTPSPAAVPAAHASTAPLPASTIEAGKAGCTVSYEITDTWPGGAQVLVTVHNAQSTRLSGWTVGWTMPAGTDIHDLWNGTLTRDGSAVTVTDAGWNALVEPNASTSFGLNQVVSAGNPGVPRLTCRAT